MAPLLGDAGANGLALILGPILGSTLLEPESSHGCELAAMGYGDKLRHVMSIYYMYIYLDMYT